MVKLDKVAHFVVSLILTIVLAIVIKSVNEDTAGIMCGILAGIVTMCIGVVMSMISSDSEETIKGMMNMMGVELDKESMFKFIYRLALDKLLDKDKMFNVRTYFHIDS